MLAARMRWVTLAPWCRAIGTMVDSGVNLLQALKVAERQVRGATELRILKDVTDSVRRGTDMAEAMRVHDPYFPTLVVDMITVAEHTGAMPEVMTGLADHYDNLLRLRRTFLGQIAWPIFQLLAAIFIVAGLILILGWVAQDQPNGEPFDPLGFGLRGEMGALIWLTYCFGSMAMLWVIYQFLTRGMELGSKVHGLMMRVPVVGPCMRDFALARFSWAYALTQQAGMEIPPSLEASLNATDNKAFAAKSPQITAAVMAGDDFTEALEATGLFPRQYIEMVRVGETSGTVPETLQRLSPQLEEQARRSLSGLTAAAAWLIWAMVATMIVFLIFRLAMFYVNMLNTAGNL